MQQPCLKQTPRGGTKIARIISQQISHFDTIFSSIITDAAELREKWGKNDFIAVVIDLFSHRLRNYCL